MTTETSGAISLDDLYSLEDFAAEHPRLITLDGLRYQMRHRDTNGLASACVRLGRRVVISKSRYQAWLGSRVGGSLTANVGAVK